MAKKIKIKHVRPSVEDLMKAKQFLEKEPKAHSEITMLLENGTVVVIPAKNEHLLENV